jgi:outer membrane protein OmpA-like peptidoglycan-associated protein
LLPGPDGKVGAVVVKPLNGDERLLDQAYAQVVAGSTEAQLAALSASDVQARYGQTLSAQPPRPLSLTVYFKSGSDQPADESLAAVEELKKAMRERPAPEIVVIGHTDRVGKLEDNDKLSLKRAEAMRSALVAVGVPGTAIEVAGRGEREPLVATADEVAEPRNRRVEINIR